MTVLVRARRAIVPVVLAVAITSVVPSTALAQSIHVEASERLATGVAHQRIRLVLSDGQVARGNVIRWRESNSEVRLQAHLAQGKVAGLGSMPSMASEELARGALAGINGGYHLPRPAGAPNGPAVHRGRLIAGHSVGRTGWPIEPSRGTVGLRTDGRVLLDRLHVDIRVTLPGLEKPRWLQVNELNRTLRCPPVYPVHCPDDRGEVGLYDGLFGARVTVPAGSTVLDLERAHVPVSGTTTARVARVRRPEATTSYTVPAGRLLFVAHGPTRGPRTALVTVGESVVIETSLRPDGAPETTWTSLDSAVPGAPLLLRGGGQFQPALYRSATTANETEALGESHRLGRHPRSAVGRSSRGDVYLVTVDGRQPGWSVGLTLLELAHVMRSLGAVDAVNLDGGGPASMTVHGSFVNRPAEPDRAHVNGLFLHVPQRKWFIQDALRKQPATRTFPFAFVEDSVLLCDWNGDGRDTPATFHNGRWVLNNRPAATGRSSTFTFGRPGDLPVCGDWNGSGRDTVGVRRGSRWLLRNANSAGSPSHDFVYGRSTDVPLVGDWNGNGRDTVGVRRGNRWLLRNANSAGSPRHDLAYGRSTDVPLVGDWNRNGRDTIGVRRSNRLLLRNRVTAGSADVVYSYGRASDVVVAGDTNSNGQDTVSLVR
jgi:hypothetical protein